MQGNKRDVDFDMRKYKLNEVDAWMIQSKHVVVCKEIKI